jgi:hypothetical protein
MGSIRRYRRPEGNVLTWSALQEPQQRALKELAGLLWDSVEDLDEGRSAADSVHAWDIRGKTSSCAFLHGDRGSGKTTVAMTLYQATRDSARLGGGSDDETPIGVPDEIRKLAGRLVWLEPIDLEPDPPNFHLMAAILTRIEQAVAPLDRHGSAHESSRSSPFPFVGSADDVGRYRDALIELRRLQTRLAYGWDGTKEILGSDPETAAGNMLFSERTRTVVARDLSRVLGQLSSAKYSRPERLFILPIEDLDLAPQECLRLLRLLRMLWIPRLFFLLIGDIDAIETQLHLQLSGDVSSLAKDAKDGHISIVSQEVQSRVDAMASNTLRKLIPPAHVIRIKEMSWTEACRFQPRRGLEVKVPSQSKDAFEKTLLDLVQLQMTKAPLGGPEYRRVVTDLLGRPKPSQGTKVDGVSESQPNRFYPSGSRALETTPRRLTDLWFVLKNETEADAPSPRLGWPGGPDQPKLIQMVGRYCRNLIEEDAALSRKAESYALGAIRETHSGAWILEYPFITVRSRGEEIVVHTDTPTTSPRWLLQRRVIAHRHREWDFVTCDDDRLSGDGQKRGDAARPEDASLGEKVLRKDTGGALALYHDLLAAWRMDMKWPWLSPFFPQGSDLGRKRDQVVWVHTELTLVDGTIVRLRWPIHGEEEPKASTFVGLDGRAKDWMAELDGIATGKEAGKPGEWSVKAIREAWRVFNKPEEHGGPDDEALLDLE